MIRGQRVNSINWKRLCETSSSELLYIQKWERHRLPPRTSGLDRKFFTFRVLCAMSSAAVVLSGEPQQKEKEWSKITVHERKCQINLSFSCVGDGIFLCIPLCGVFLFQCEE